MRTVVVTGVSGSLGRRVAELLDGVREPIRVIGIDRVVAPERAPSVEFHRLDLAEDPGVEALLRGCDAVVHLAWDAADLTGRDRQDPTATSDRNQRALRRVLQAAGEAAPSSLVHLSSATVYGAWSDNQVPLTEEAPLRPNPELAFAVGKAEAERQVTDWAEDHPEVGVAVLRPAVTVGWPERPLYQALGGTRAPRGSGDSPRPVQFLHVDDLASAVVHVCVGGHRGVFNVAPDHGIGEDLARSLAGGVAKLTLPARAARAVGAWTWDLWRSGVPKEARAYATHPWVVAADRLMATGWSPEYTSEEALVATDVRAHWDDLPPGTRQNYTLLVAVGGATAAGAAVAGAALAIRRRRRR
ncbi:MAG: NAD-dependent epimerase/dehydratase family protein [Acidimicrobiales bacterium]